MSLPASQLEPDLVPAAIHEPGSPVAHVLCALERLAPSGATVLLTGEAGTGKTALARLVHERGAWPRGPFVRVDCATLPERPPHGDGAWAELVAQALGGTLVLDEVGALTPAQQEEALGLLERKSQGRRAGASVRVVATTSVELSGEVEAGRFRRELYLRLMEASLVIPPLRARTGDVRALIGYFWARRGERRVIEPRALRALEQHPWRGNVRELERVVETLAVTAPGATVGLADLPAEVQRSAPEAAATALTLVPPPAQEPEAAACALPPAPAEPGERAAPRAPAAIEPLTLPVDLPALLRELEERYLAAALARTGGNRKAAADLLGLRRTTLVEKLRRKTKTPAAA